MNIIHCTIHMLNLPISRKVFDLGERSEENVR